MDTTSITGTGSFAFRLQKSELLRARLMVGLYGFLLVVAVVRRLAGGVVMGSDLLFALTVGVTLAAITLATLVTVRLKRDLVQSQITDAWWVRNVSWFEIAWPALLLTLLHYLSPLSDRTALSAPVLLMLPLTVLMSILRLRPRLTVMLGLAGAAVHLLLVLDTYLKGHLPLVELPRYHTYAIILAIHGIAGGIVCYAARRYLTEAVDEALAAQTTAGKLQAIERDLEVARKIQATLLPSTAPCYGGYDIAGMNKPADQTGGDYYDWQILPDGRLLVTIADVTGHGIGPALVMAVCRAYSRASAPLEGGPGMLLNRLNTMLHNDMEGGRFITLATATLSPDGVVEFISAGHGPSLLLTRQCQDVRHFDGDGLPLAIFPDQDYGLPHTALLHSGDILVMITDGVIEWHDASGEQFGSQRVIDLVRQAKDQPAETIVKQLFDSVISHARGAKQLDDVTIVIIKRIA